MHFECRTSAVRLMPEVWLEGASNDVWIHLECCQNVPGMAAEYGFERPRMQTEWSSNT